VTSIGVQSADGDGSMNLRSSLPGIVQGGDLIGTQH